jgi:hypothetical protein
MWWGKKYQKKIEYFLHLVVVFPMGIFVNYMSSVYCCHLMCICCTVCIAVLTLDAGLLASSQYPGGPATGHLDTGFSLFPCLQANAQTVPQFPSCYYTPLM